jgi:DNA-binding transcriptional ArsR family regulator
MANELQLSEDQAALGLGALGKAVRLRLFKLLVQAGHEGLNIGQLQQLLDIPASTLTHHILKLVQSDLVIQTRQGREVICTANFTLMNALALYLTDQCCDGIHLQQDVATI